MLAIHGRKQKLDDLYVRSKSRLARSQKRRLERPLLAEGYLPEDVGETEDREEVVRLGIDENGSTVRLDHDGTGHQEIQLTSLPKAGWTTSLWKPTTRYLCKRCHHLDSLARSTPSDFCGRSGGYLYTSRDLPTTYARFMDSLIGGGSSTARLIRIDIPAYYIESLRPFHWEFDVEYEEWPLLMGNICKSDVRAVAQLARWRDVSKERLVKDEGAGWDDDEEEAFERERGFAIQYAFFSGEKTIERLVAEGELLVREEGWGFTDFVHQRRLRQKDSPPALPRTRLLACLNQHTTSPDSPRVKGEREKRTISPPT